MSAPGRGVCLWPTTPWRFPHVALADSGKEVASTEARDQTEEHDALRLLTAKALHESKLLGVHLNLVAAWPDCAVRVGRVEGDKVTWVLGADGRVWA